ncbi:MAG: PAS domain S-box protein [Oscillochloris sp.]|nr:PAS domain S-box protein [Oscillochloris sp.]
MTASDGLQPDTLFDQAMLRARLSQLEQENAQLRQQIGIDHSLLRHGPIVLFKWACIPYWDIEFASPNVSNLLGYTDEEFISGCVAYRSLVHPDDIERVESELQRNIHRGAETFEQEYRIFCKEGSTRWVYSFMIIVRDDQEVISHYIGYLLDITGHRLAEEALQEQSRFFHTVIDQMPISVFVKAAQDRRFVMWNKATEQMMGFTAEQVLGNTHHRIFPPDLATIFDRQDDELLARGELVDLPCVPFHSKTLGPRSLHTIKVPVYDSAGNPLYVLGISEDITAHRQMEDQLDQQVRLLTNLINTLPFPVFYKDSNGTYRGCNQSFAENIVGRSIDAIVGQNHHEIFSAKVATLIDKIESSVLAHHGAQHLEFDWIYTDGQSHAVILYISSFSRPDGSPGGILGAMVDITDHKHAEAEKSALQEQIIAAQQAAIRDISAPLLPLAKHVVALPLIGAIDSARAQHITEILLSGISSQHAEVAIIDITGVPIVDTQVANAIIHAAQAVKLLGAQVVLTGIRPEVAQTLVQLGIDLSGIVTRSTLLSAISYALNNVSSRRRPVTDPIHQPARQLSKR